jgi:peptidoglycan-associated lipoprotein
VTCLLWGLRRIRHGLPCCAEQPQDLVRAVSQGFNDMRMKLIGLVGVILLLAACSSTPPAPPPAPPAGPSGPSAGSVIPGSQQDLAQNAGDRVFFEFDRSDITPEAQQILQRQASWLQHYPNVSVTIEGHCDERGTREYNLALGERRATAVKNVLVAAGIPASRISTISYGKERPIVVGSNEEAWSQNRVAITTVN